jgi:hypothetical protein
LATWICPWPSGPVENETEDSTIAVTDNEFCADALLPFIACE